MIAAGLKDRLMTALQSAVGDLNAGMDPNESVAKAAAAADFNVEQTRRLCETFNTARTLYHFEARPQEKEASFPLADQQAVLQAVFANDAAQPEKAAADVLPDYSEYAGREYMARHGMIVTAEDAAADAVLFDKAAEALPDINEQIRRAYVMIDSQRNLAKNAISDAEQADIVISNRLTKLAGAITRSCDVDGPDAYARFVRCYTDQEWYPMLTKLSEFLPKRVQVTADMLQRQGTVVEDRDLGEWKSLFKSSRDLSQQAANLRAAAQTMAKEAADFEEQFLGSVQKAYPAMEADTFDHLFSDFEEKHAQEIKETYTTTPFTVADFFAPAPQSEYEQELQDEKRKRTVTKTKGPGLGGAIAGGAATGVGDAAKAYIGEGFSTLLNQRQQGMAKENRKITERLKNQQREVLMQDLMLNDPFISEAEPSTVAQAYEAIMAIAPEVSTQKEIVRAILRQAIQTVAVGAYDAAAWADLEKTIRETAGTLPARPKPEEAKR